MLAIAQFKTQPIYIAKDRLMDLSNNALIGRTARMLNLARELRFDLGTHHPESIEVDVGLCFAFDEFSGKQWMYSANGQTPISDYKKTNYYHELAKGRFLGGEIISKFQREHGSLLTTFAGDGIITWGFDDRKNGYGSEFSFQPERYGKVGLVFVSFKDGALWRHEDEVVARSNYYGVQYRNMARVVINPEPLSAKIWWNVKIGSDKKFFIPVITTPISDLNASGQLSELIENKFINYEGLWFADFLRDINDNSDALSAATDVEKLLRGQHLRSEVLILELENFEQGKDFLLNSVEVEYTLSHDTI